MPGLLFRPAVSAAALASLIVAGVTLVTWRSAIPFDPAYNLLPYKNLVESGRYEHRYGSLTTPFQPAVSTGPTVNLPIAAVYAAVPRPETWFAATALTVGGYWALFLAAFLVLQGDGALLGMVLLTPLVVVNVVAFEDRLITAAFGELPAVALVCTAFALAARGRPHRALGALCLGLAVVTKTAVAVGLALPAALAAAGMLYGERRRRAFRHRGEIALLATLVAAPVLVWRFVVPWLVLSDDAWRRMSDAARARSAFETRLAFGDAIAVVRTLLERAALDDGLPARIASRADGFAAVHADHAATWAYVIAAAVATAWCLRGARPEDRAAGWIGAFGFGTLVWWLLANRLGWYRHVFPADLAFAVVIVHAVVATLRSAGAGGARRTVAVAMYVAAFMALAALGLAQTHRYRATIVAGARAKQAALTVAALVRERLGERTAFYAVGWYQAPQIQLLAQNAFTDVQVPGDVAADLGTGRTPYLVVTPETLSYERAQTTELPELRAAARRTLFDDCGYQLLELDAAALRALIERRAATR